VVLGHDNVEGCAAPFAAGLPASVDFEVAAGLFAAGGAAIHRLVPLMSTLTIPEKRPRMIAPMDASKIE
jgi:hypothetical protein